MLTRFVLPGIACLMAGCVTQAKINRERAEFVKDPFMGTHGYTGFFSGGDHYQFLAKNDPRFSEFLLVIVAQTKDPEIVHSALHYAAKRGISEYNQLVERIDPELLSAEVTHGYSDALVMMTLAEWIEFIRPRAKAASRASTTTKNR